MKMKDKKSATSPAKEEVVSEEPSEKDQDSNSSSLDKSDNDESMEYEHKYENDVDNSILKRRKKKVCGKMDLSIPK